MGKLFFNIFYGITWLGAQIPLVIIHRLADFTFLIIYYAVKYRRAVVRINLQNSFPEKSIDEIIVIEKKFYRHLSDLFFETLFMLHASKRRALKRCKFNNLEIFDDLYKKGKSAILTSGHYGNWEYHALMSEYVKQIPHGIYKPLTSKNFEKLMNNTRKRFGGVPVAMQDTLREIVKCQRNGILFLLGLVADQTPTAGGISYWTNFLNQDTPVFLGIEKLAQKFDLPVYYCHMQKVKRSYYEVNFILLTDKPKETLPYEITELYVKTLENQIREQPELWLWSHRRWKHKHRALPQEMN